MSTTAETDAGTIRVLDDPKTIVKKLKSAETDSGSEVRRAPDKPGIANLIDILAVMRGTTPEEIEREFDGQGYGVFKTGGGGRDRRLAGTGPRALPGAARPTRPRSTRCSARAPRRRARSPP